MHDFLVRHAQVISIAALFLVAMVALYFRALSAQLPVYPAQPLEIETFEACVEAGYPVGESYPRQCFGPDGLTFYEEIPDDELVACTMDAKICPDGSAVGRVGPDCEFAPCPGE